MYTLGIDQGTSGSRAILLREDGRVAGYAYRPLMRQYPRPGWVEQEPSAVAAGVAEAVTAAIGQAGIDPTAILACGISCQRNTLFAWDGRTGRPLGSAIVWQDLRTEPLLAELEAWPLFQEARDRLGYAPGTYMGALHLAWRLRHEPETAAAAREGRLRIGLSAAWLIEALGGPTGHAMDLSLVQATGLYDFRGRQYWGEWLDRLGIPPTALPTPVSTVHDYGVLRVTAPNGQTAEVPVLAMVGDQQAALFGHRCWLPGQAECTHGTASYLEVNMGERLPAAFPASFYHAWTLAGRDTWCLEAATSVTGAVLRWMRETLRFFEEYDEIDALVCRMPDSGGVYFVPAFTGLEHPHLAPNARGTLFGLTLGTERPHILRAFLESIGFQLRDILHMVAAETGVAVKTLRVGGGVSGSDAACQIQADMLGIPVERPAFRETTSWAAAALAGIGQGFWSTPEALPPTPGSVDRFEPRLPDADRDDRFARWQHAVTLTRSW